MTKEYTISTEFEGSWRDIVNEAVSKSALPEGVHVIKGNEIASAEKPFVVVTWSPIWQEAREAMLAGAENYVSADINPQELAKKLTSKSL